MKNRKLFATVLCRTQSSRLAILERRDDCCRISFIPMPSLQLPKVQLRTNNMFPNRLIFQFALLDLLPFCVRMTGLVVGPYRSHIICQFQPLMFGQQSRSELPKSHQIRSQKESKFQRGYQQQCPLVLFIFLWYLTSNRGTIPFVVCVVEID